MRALLLASASVLLIGGTALAQNSNSPLSNAATHTKPGNTTGAVAPRLPVPAQDASVDQFLAHAESALKRGRTGEAQEALERAETRALSRSTDPSLARTPDNDPKTAAIQAARHSLGSGDRAQAMQAIRSALATPSVSAAAVSASPDVANATPPTPWTGPGPDPNVVPNSLGGISGSVGGAGGAGGNQRRPQASFSGPSPNNAVPPNSLGGISGSVGGAGGAGGNQARPQANFGGGTENVPPNTLGGISGSVGGAGGSGGNQARPQASFSGPGSTQVIVPGAPGNAAPSIAQ